MGRKPIHKALPDYEPIAYDKIILCQCTAAKLGSKERTFLAPTGLLVGLCQKGSMTIEINKQKIAIKANDFFGVAPGQMFSTSKPSRSLEFSLIYIPLGFFLAFSREIDRRFIHSVLCNDVFRLEDEYVAEIGDLLKIAQRHGNAVGNFVFVDDQANQDLVIALIDAMILLCNDAIATASGEMVSHAQNDKASLIARHFFANVIKYHTENHSVEYYANMEGISAKYLSMIISKSTGRTPQEWISLLLIYSSQRLLQTHEYSVAEVAEMLHFTSSSTFIRFFKNQTGMTPRASAV